MLVKYLTIAHIPDLILICRDVQFLANGPLGLIVARLVQVGLGSERGFVDMV